MTGIFISRGMTVAVPAGGFVLYLYGCLKALQATRALGDSAPIALVWMVLFPVVGGIHAYREGREGVGSYSTTRKQSS